MVEPEGYIRLWQVLNRAGQVQPDLAAFDDLLKRSGVNAAGSRSPGARKAPPPVGALLTSIKQQRSKATTFSASTDQAQLSQQPAPDGCEDRGLPDRHLGHLGLAPVSPNADPYLYSTYTGSAAAAVPAAHTRHAPARRCRPTTAPASHLGSRQGIFRQPGCLLRKQPPDTTQTNTTDSHSGKDLVNTDAIHSVSKLAERAARRQAGGTRKLAGADGDRQSPVPITRSGSKRTIVASLASSMTRSDAATADALPSSLHEPYNIEVPRGLPGSVTSGTAAEGVLGEEQEEEQPQDDSQHAIHRAQTDGSSGRHGVLSTAMNGEISGGGQAVLAALAAVLKPVPEQPNQPPSSLSLRPGLVPRLALSKATRVVSPALASPQAEEGGTSGRAAGPKPTRTDKHSRARDARDAQSKAGQQPEVPLSPHARYQDIQARIARIEHRQRIARRRAGGKAPDTRSNIEQWAAAWLPSLHKGLQVVGGASFGAHGSNDSDVLQPAGSGTETGLTQHEQAVRDINTSLELLDMFTMVAPDMRRRRLAERVEAEAASHVDPRTGLHTLPRAPQPFPSSSAWDYLVACQVSAGGLADLEGVMARMRHLLKVATERGGMALGTSGTSALQAIEQELQLCDLASVRSTATARSRLMHVSDDTTPRDSARAAAPNNAVSVSGVSHALLDLAALGDSILQSGTTTGSAGAASSSGALMQTGQLNTCEPNAEPAQPGTSSQPQDTQHVLVTSSKAASGPPGVSTSLTGAAGSADAAPVAGPAQQTAVEDLWGWLETMMIEMHEHGRSRQDIAELAGSLPQGAPGLPPPTNPHTAEPLPLDAVSSLVDQVTRVHAAIMGGQDTNNLAEFKSQMPYIDQAALRAATITHFDPANTERLLYFLVRLGICIETGALPAKDAGFLLAASLQLLLGEVTWLLAMLRVQQGPASPHLRALHATLRAYDAQADYSQRIAHRLEQYRLELDSALVRARYSETQARDLQVELSAAAQSVSVLSFHNKELTRDNDALQARVRELEQEVQRLQGQADLDAEEAQATARAQVLREAGLFRQRSRGWHAQVVDSLSKGVQVATSGRCNDPFAIPEEVEEEQQEVSLTKERSQAGSATGSLKRGISQRQRVSDMGKAGRQSMSGGASRLSSSGRGATAVSTAGRVVAGEKRVSVSGGEAGQGTGVSVAAAAGERQPGRMSVMTTALPPLPPTQEAPGMGGDDHDDETGSQLGDA